LRICNFLFVLAIIVPTLRAQLDPDESLGRVGLTIHDRETPDAPLRIVYVTRSSAAEKAGVKIPAYLLAVNRTNITEMPRSDALELIRGPIGTSVTIQTTDFDRRNTNTYRLVRSRLNFGTNVPSSRGSIGKITTNELLIAKTRAGDSATIQFLSFSPSLDENGVYTASAIYRVRMTSEPGQNEFPEGIVHKPEIGKTNARYIYDSAQRSLRSYKNRNGEDGVVVWIANVRPCEF
jgi:hypothetical protein